MEAIVARLGAVHPDRGRLLDIGTGVGILMHAASKDGWLVEGVEPSETAAERARKLTGATVHSGLLEDVKLPEEYYDAVTIIDTLRSVPDPLAFLFSARRLIRPGGILLVREVYRTVRRYYSRLLGTSEGLKLKGKRRAYQHAQGFSPKSLLFALHAIGLEGSVEPSPIFVELEAGGGLLSEISKRAVGLGSSALYQISRHRFIFSPNLLAFGRAPNETKASRPASRAV
jgi:SAM-dependent methyltransferase